MREEIGVDRLMWGADYPHLEGAAPVHRQILRHVFGGMPEQDAGESSASTRSTFGLRPRPPAGRRRSGGADRRGPLDPAVPSTTSEDLQLEPGPTGPAGRARLLARGRRAGPARNPSGGPGMVPAWRRHGAAGVLPRRTVAPVHAPRPGSRQFSPAGMVPVSSARIATAPCFHDLDAVGIPCRIARGPHRVGSGQLRRPRTLVEELHRLSSRAEAFVTEATAAFESNEEWAADGAKTAAGVDRDAFLPGAPQCGEAPVCASGGRSGTCPSAPGPGATGTSGWTRRRRSPGPVGIAPRPP